MILARLRRQSHHWIALKMAHKILICLVFRLWLKNENGINNLKT